MFAFCMNCLVYRNGDLITRDSHFNVRGLTVAYQETVCICTVCGSEIYHYALNDTNSRARLAAYRKAKGEKRT